MAVGLNPNWHMTKPLNLYLKGDATHGARKWSKNKGTRTYWQLFLQKKTKKIWIEIDLIKVINFDQKPDEKNGLKSSLDCAYVWCVAVNTEHRINQVQYGRLYDFSRAKNRHSGKKNKLPLITSVKC